MAVEEKIKLEDTIITPDMVDQIDEEDYIYYYLPPRVKPWSKLYRFEPDEDTKIMARNTKNWQRLIFSNGNDYTDFEEEKYQEALEYIENNGYEFPDIVEKRSILRFLQANDYKIKPSIRELESHLEWRDKHLPIILNAPMQKLISGGYLYTHGRDKVFRPLIIHYPRVYKEIKPEENDALFS